MITLERLIGKTCVSDDAFVCKIDDFNLVLEELIDCGFKIECCNVDVLMEEPFIVEFDEGAVTIEQYSEGYKFFHAVDALHVDKSVQKKFYIDVRRNHTFRFELDYVNKDSCDCDARNVVNRPENPDHECETDCSRCDNCGSCSEVKTLSVKEEEDKATYFVNGVRVDFAEYENARKRIDKRVKQIEDDIGNLKSSLFEKWFI